VLHSSAVGKDLIECFLVTYFLHFIVNLIKEVFIWLERLYRLDVGSNLLQLEVLSHFMLVNSALEVSLVLERTSLKSLQLLYLIDFLRKPPSFFFSFSECLLLTLFLKTFTLHPHGSELKVSLPCFFVFLALSLQHQHFLVLFFTLFVF